MASRKTAAKKAAANKNGNGNPKPTDESALVTTREDDADLPAELMDMVEEDGAEDAALGKDDLAIPRLVIIQALSEAVKPAKGGYIPEASVGQIYDGINGADGLFDGDEGIHVIPLTYRRTIIEWRKRELGGGFIADLGLDFDIANNTVKDEKRRDVIIPEGESGAPGETHAVMTAEYICFLVDRESGDFKPVILSMTSTQLKKSRAWNSISDAYRVKRTDGKGTFNPKRYFLFFHLQTVPESNAEGDWMGWRISKRGKTMNLPNGSSIYAAAKKFRADIEAGAIDIKPPSDDGGGGSGGGSFTPPEDDTTAPM